MLQEIQALFDLLSKYTESDEIVRLLIDDIRSNDDFIYHLTELQFPQALHVYTSRAEMARLNITPGLPGLQETAAALQKYEQRDIGHIKIHSVHCKHGYMVFTNSSIEEFIGIILNRDLDKRKVKTLNQEYLNKGLMVSSLTISARDIRV